MAHFVWLEAAVAERDVWRSVSMVHGVLFVITGLPRMISMLKLSADNWDIIQLVSDF